jgi:hypothetical protein
VTRLVLLFGVLALLSGCVTSASPNAESAIRSTNKGAPVNARAQAHRQSPLIIVGTGY